MQLHIITPSAAICNNAARGNRGNLQEWASWARGPLNTQREIHLFGWWWTTRLLWEHEHEPDYADGNQWWECIRIITDPAELIRSNPWEPQRLGNRERFCLRSPRSCDSRVLVRAWRCSRVYDRGFPRGFCDKHASWREKKDRQACEITMKLYRNNKISNTLFYTYIQKHIASFLIAFYSLKTFSLMGFCVHTPTYNHLQWFIAALRHQMRTSWSCQEAYVNMVVFLSPLRPMCLDY